MNLLRGLRQAEGVARAAAMLRAINEVIDPRYQLNIESCTWMHVAEQFRIRISARNPNDGQIEQEFEHWVESPVYRQVYDALEISEDDWAAILDGVLTTYQLTIYQA